MTSIEREFDLHAAVHFEDKFLINYYSIVCSMNVETESIREQNIAMDRIKCLLDDCLSNSVLVHDSEKKAIEKYTSAGMKVCTLPEEPYDQITALMLFHKLNAITEGRIEITAISLDSVVGDGVRFIYDAENAEHPYKSGWWNEPGPSITSTVSNKKEKIVKLVKQSDWSVYDLEWKQSSSVPTEIIFSQDLDKSQP
jgi:hypothetical protein